MSESNVTTNIVNRILVIRGERVILDTDLATLYGVPTKALNQAVKRNYQRFPSDFMFQLSESEKEEVVTNCDHLKKVKFYKGLPYAFTEHGAVMAATILNTPQAVSISIYVVRAFIQIREMLTHHKTLLKKLTDLEQRISTHDTHIRSLFNAIRQLMSPPPKPKRKIGFLNEE
ncbi:MAG: hypothetical protein COV45_06400 [Deltaproteobacteria bacterium CG11_big_fil_rev_8_21_14_0_20_47_16]|nr:MAG: hypothetical protein COV45_06400 [Deltaproteobacteria bacterium CG11_big_fil_rev_8_21_14_0_20_47_16]